MTDEIIEKIDDYLNKQNITLESKYFIAKQLMESYWDMVLTESDGDDDDDDDDEDFPDGVLDEDEVLDEIEDDETDIEEELGTIDEEGLDDEIPDIDVPEPPKPKPELKPEPEPKVNHKVGIKKLLKSPKIKIKK